MRKSPYDSTEATQSYTNHYLGTQQGGSLPVFGLYRQIQTGNGLWDDILKSAVPPHQNRS